MLRHRMHELPACLLFAWVRIDTRLQITSTPAAAWALTTLCSVMMHCNFQTSAWRGGVGKGIPTFLLYLNTFLPFLLLSPVPFSFLLLIPVCILLLLSPHGHACLCFYITLTLLQFNLLHKPGQQGQNIPVSVHNRLSVNQAVDLQVVHLSVICLLHCLAVSGYLSDIFSHICFWLPVGINDRGKFESCRLQIRLTVEDMSHAFVTKQMEVQ